MDKKQIQALVNKGAITHVGVATDLEKLSDKEICDKFVTKHEVAGEVLSGDDSVPEVPVEEAVATQAEETQVEAPAPKKATKKSTKKDPAPVEEAEVPEVDPTKE